MLQQRLPWNYGRQLCLANTLHSKVINRITHLRLDGKKIAPFIISWQLKSVFVVLLVEIRLRKFEIPDLHVWFLLLAALLRKAGINSRNGLLWVYLARHNASNGRWWDYKFNVLFFRQG